MDGPQVIIKLILRSSRGNSCRNMFCLSFYHARLFPARPSSSRRYIRPRCAFRTPYLFYCLSLSLTHVASHFRSARTEPLSPLEQPNIFIRPLGERTHVRLLKRFHPEEGERAAFAIRFTPRIPFIVRDVRRSERT